MRWNKIEKCFVSSKKEEKYRKGYEISVEVLNKWDVFRYLFFVYSLLIIIIFCFGVFNLFGK